MEKYEQGISLSPYFLIGAKFYKAPNVGIAASNFSGDRISEERERGKEREGQRSSKINRNKG